MKKLFLVLVLAFVGIFTANAQVWIGGSASAQVTKDHNAFSIAPEVGYMIPNTPFTIAAGVNYMHNDEGLNNLVLSPYFRYVPCTIGEKKQFSLFLDLTADFAPKFGKINNNWVNGYAIGLQPGIAWMATEHWTAAFRFAYAEYRHNLNPHAIEAVTENGFFMNFTLGTPWIGLYYNF